MNTVTNLVILGMSLLVAKSVSEYVKIKNEKSESNLIEMKRMNKEDRAERVANQRITHRIRTGKYQEYTEEEIEMAFEFEKIIELEK